jgi:hypothetical protein
MQGENGQKEYRILKQEKYWVAGKTCLQENK